MANKYRKDPFWNGKKLTPGQIQCYDVHLSESVTQRDERLELDEVLPSALVPEEGFATSPHMTGSQERWQRIWEDVTGMDLLSRIEEQSITNLHQEYGWASALRLKAGQENVECRWIHVSSKLCDNLTGLFVGMSDWSRDLRSTVESLRHLKQVVQDQERFSKHGKMFAPFCLPLRTSSDEDSSVAACLAGGQSTTTSTMPSTPVVMSVPFLDYTVHPNEDEPPLRFQVDERDNFYSTRSASHPLRSLLQYYYRLEDTSERERNQVFAKHKPWNTDRDIDLRVRRWYGHYPAGMIVDEMWVLVIDERHIVTFAANQSWKARWPPLQLSSRIWELSFRSLRDQFRVAGNKVKYCSIFHAIACLHGAVGLMHRTFWTDLPLPCTERYGGYLSHLQYRIYRSPSTRLVMELLQTQDELNIVSRIMQQQQSVLTTFHDFLMQRYARVAEQQSRRAVLSGTESTLPVPNTLSSHVTSYTPTKLQPTMRTDTRSTVSSQGESLGKLSSPTALLNTVSCDLTTLLTRERDDVSELLTSTNELLSRTIQLVNIRMEDHGQAILVFTVVTVIFLPLSFMSSFFGMNTQDIRNLDYSQGLFWLCSLLLTLVVVALSILLAFFGGPIKEQIGDWRSGRASQVSWPRFPWRWQGGRAKSRKIYAAKEIGWPGQGPAPGKKTIVLDSAKRG